MGLFLAVLLSLSIAQADTSPVMSPALPSPGVSPIASPVASPIASIEKIEVLIGHVFIKKSGYSDVDNIQFVIDGYLPSSCYRLDQTQIEKDPDQPSVMTVHQYALHSTNTSCTLGIVPYSVTETLGKLTEGDYELGFNIGSNPPLSASFEVDSSRSTVVYPEVTSVAITDSFTRSTHRTSATLTGMLPSLCSQIERIQVTNENDVIVVSPILKSHLGPDSHDCPQIQRPFQATVSLGNLEEGRYLAQVSSAHGDLMKTFSVLRDDPE